MIRIPFLIAQRFDNQDRCALNALKEECLKGPNAKHYIEVTIGAVMFDMTIDEKLRFSKQFRKRRAQIEKKIKDREC